jgi:hypothetical protein
MKDPIFLVDLEDVKKVKCCKCCTDEGSFYLDETNNEFYCEEHAFSTMAEEE